MSMIDLKIVTPERVVYKNKVKQITLPTADGEITILPNHRSYIASLETGEMIAKTENEEEVDLAVAGGFVEFYDNKLVVLADEAERAEEIDLKEAEKARKKAEELKKKKITADDTDYAQVAATLKREMNRIKVAKRYLKRKGL